MKLTRGQFELDVPLRLKTGPTVMLHMKACLLTPDINLSSPTLAFGPVQTGKCKVTPSSYPHKYIHIYDFEFTSSMLSQCVHCFRSLASSLQLTVFVSRLSMLLC